ncbi:hypothetical protein DRQ18_01580 [bacterium]|nr:MAG: hypothetical protein DRQ18_01580 [bacterium]
MIAQLLFPQNDVDKFLWDFYTFYMQRENVYQYYFHEIEKLPDVSREDINKLAVEVKEGKKELSELMNALLKPVKRKVCEVVGESCQTGGDLVNEIISRVKVYLENFDPGKGDFWSYFFSHIKKEILQNYSRLEGSTMSYDALVREPSVSPDPVMGKIEAEKKWKNLQWRSKLYLTLYCLLHAGYPDFKIDENTRKKFADCCLSPPFNLELLSLLLEERKHLVEAHNVLLNALKEIVEKCEMVDEKTKQRILGWNSCENLRDGIRNLREWLRKEMRDG